MSAESEEAEQAAQRARSALIAIGSAVACESYAEVARRKSGELFAQCHDAEARVWRDVAEWLDGMGKRHRAEQRNHEGRR